MRASTKSLHREQIRCILSKSKVICARREKSQARFLLASLARRDVGNVPTIKPQCYCGFFYSQTDRTKSRALNHPPDPRSGDRITSAVRPRVSSPAIVGLGQTLVRGTPIREVEMSAQIIQFVPRPNPNRTAVTMEQQAIGLVDYINGLVGVPYGGSGIDGMDVTQANAFHAPENDSA